MRRDIKDILLEGYSTTADTDTFGDVCIKLLSPHIKNDMSKFICPQNSDQFDQNSVVIWADNLSDLLDIITDGELPFSLSYIPENIARLYQILDAPEWYGYDITKEYNKFVGDLQYIGVPFPYAEKI
nr:MAG TPA: hypothetical protein [Caudoviricetes sp.]